MVQVSGIQRLCCDAIGKRKVSKRTSRHNTPFPNGTSTPSMSIQWFPGHMHLTRQAIAERIKAIDVVI